MGGLSATNAAILMINDASQLYDVRIEIGCVQQECSGEAEITLSQKGRPQVFQKFSTTQLSFYLPKHDQSDVDHLLKYDNQSGVIFGDFNFDGNEDIAIQDGNYGAYGGVTYDIYVMNRKRQKFIYSAELSRLTQESLGMFRLDPDTKRIITLNKSGCCNHTRSEYEVVPQKGLLLSREYSEVLMLSGEEVEIIDRKLVNGHWQEQIWHYPIKQYHEIEKQ
ncbi:XAC2610-related protein [Acinetobacter populi]|nr:hypothetical protein [Acinetobacter populi]